MKRKRWPLAPLLGAAAFVFACSRAAPPSAGPQTSPAEALPHAARAEGGASEALPHARTDDLGAVPVAAGADPGAGPLEGCWVFEETPEGSDLAPGSGLCVDAHGVTLLFDESRWDRLEVEWTERSAARLAGRPQGAPEARLALALAEGRLELDDGRGLGRARRAAGEEAAVLSRRAAAATAEGGELCEQARRCRDEAARLLGSDLEAAPDRPAHCASTLRGLAAILEASGHPLPEACSAPSP